VFPLDGVLDAGGSLLSDVGALPHVVAVPHEVSGVPLVPQVLDHELVEPELLELLVPLVDPELVVEVLPVEVLELVPEVVPEVVPELDPLVPQVLDHELVDPEVPVLPVLPVLPLLAQDVVPDVFVGVLPVVVPELVPVLPVLPVLPLLAQDVVPDVFVGVLPVVVPELVPVFPLAPTVFPVVELQVFQGEETGVFQLVFHITAVDVLLLSVGILFGLGFVLAGIF